MCVQIVNLRLSYYLMTKITLCVFSYIKFYI